MQNPLRLIIFLVLLASLLLGCSSGSRTAAALPTPTPIPGWKEFTAPGVSLWLPDSFEGGDLANDLDVITTQLKTRGTEYEAVVKMIEQNQSAFTIWAFDTITSPTGALTNVNVVKEKVLSAVTLENYADAVTNQLPSDFTITERKEVKLDNHDALRLTLEMSEPSIKEIMYLVKVGNTMWVTTYATGADEFIQRLPIFEQSINTLQLEP
jgi:hypothetical protein